MKVKSKQMKLQVGNSIVNTFPRMNYTWWHAIAEFVDNSTQSYFDNREQLDNVYKQKNEGLKVSITRGKNSFRISDNAFGMNEKTLERALTVAEPPPIPKGASKHGRSRYGMGMKTSSGWMGSIFTIRTIELGSGIEYSTKIDWDKVSEGNDELEIGFREVDKTNSGTIIEISNMHNPMQGNTVKKCKDYLESMYRIDIREDTLCLEWDGKPLKPYGWSEGEWQLRPNGEPWKKDLKNLFTKSNPSTGKTAKEISGWVGVLGQGKARRVKAGFSIFHNNRQVIGYPEAWRPSKIFGDLGSNDLINQRLTGELHLDDFEVSHTKDGIYWRHDEEREVGNLIRTQCEDLITQAKKTYKSQNVTPEKVKKAYEDGAKVVEKEIEDVILDREVDIAVVSPPKGQDETRAQIESTVSAAKSKKKPSMKVELSQYNIEVFLSSDGIDKPYYVNSSFMEEKETLYVVVNTDHPWFQNIDPDIVQLNLKHVIYDAISEHTAGLLKRSDHTTVNMMKDNFLRIPWKISNN